jgi:hypothetical protein
VPGAPLSSVRIDMSVIFRIFTHLFFRRAEFRNKDCFLSSYEKIYGYAFTEKLNKLAEESREESEDKLAEEAGEISNNKLNSDV